MSVMRTSDMLVCEVANTHSRVDGVAALSVGGGHEGRGEDDGGTHVD